jgi:hypothetical protein
MGAPLPEELLKGAGSRKVRSQEVQWKEVQQKAMPSGALGSMIAPPRSYSRSLSHSHGPVSGGQGLPIDRKMANTVAGTALPGQCHTWAEP